MSGDKFILDTNTILYILNGDETLADFLFEKELYLSIITEMELLSYKKITPMEQKKIEEFVKEMRVININEGIKNLVIHIKKDSNLKLPDSIIAATAIWLNIPFVTSDKHFGNLQSLNLIYYEK